MRMQLNFMKSGKKDSEPDKASTVRKTVRAVCVKQGVEKIVCKRRGKT